MSALSALSYTFFLSQADQATAHAHTHSHSRSHSLVLTRTHSRTYNLSFPLTLLFHVHLLSLPPSSLYPSAAAACQAVRQSIEAHAQRFAQQNRPFRVGIITFDNEVHFYNLSASLAQPQMMTVSDIDDVFVPLQSGLLVNAHEVWALVVVVVVVLHVRVLA